MLWKNIYNKVHILNTKDLIEAISPLWWYRIWIYYVLNLTQLWELIKKPAESSCFCVGHWVWNHHRLAELAIGKKNWMWSGAEQGQAGTCKPNQNLSPPTSVTWENHRKSQHNSLKSYWCTFPEDGDGDLIGG